ncbi:hypothetical protein IX84_30390 [Phaeodactylibacter xiamenensis]|uniref:Uncharacterized protein n=1 Tax=Phaeodactylibacter xiamenensis TaxID=1524460 RepID=A0A098RXX2_9BACT|nr:hypothetical protein IX84_30390 [Phaeodactylibacter xiamenensis]
MYAISRLDTTIPPSLTELKQPFARQPESLKNKKCFSKGAYPIKPVRIFFEKPWLSTLSETNNPCTI